MPNLEKCQLSLGHGYEAYEMEYYSNKSELSKMAVVDCRINFC